LHPEGRAEEQQREHTAGAELARHGQGCPRRILPFPKGLGPAPGQQTPWSDVSGFAL